VPYIFIARQHTDARAIIAILSVRLSVRPSRSGIIIIITDVYSAFRSEDTKALDAAQNN